MTSRGKLVPATLRVRSPTVARRDLGTGAGHFIHKTLRHQKISAEVSGHFGTKELDTSDPSRPIQEYDFMYRSAEVSRSNCPGAEVFRLFLELVPKCLKTFRHQTLRYRCRSVLWPKSGNPRRFQLQSTRLSQLYHPYTSLFSINGGLGNMKK